VKFHNGQEMTASDVKFAVVYSMDPKNSAYGLSRLALVDSVEAIENYVVRIVMKKPSAAFLSALTDIRSFPVVPQGSVPSGNQKMTEFPPGTGPLRFVEWKPRQQIVFERFDAYWGQKSYVDRVVLRPIIDDTVRFNALQAGDVDLIERTPYEWAKQVLEGKVKGVKIVEAPYADYQHLTFNVADPPFNNKKLRHAGAHAVDKKEILNATYFGFGQTTDQKYPKGHLWYIDGLASPTYDLEKARALLREAGYKGEIIEIKIPQQPDNVTSHTVLQAQLKKIGMNVQLKVFDYGAHREFVRRGENTINILGSGFYPDPAIAYGQSLACEPDSKNRVSNYAGYCDKEVDELLARAESETDVKKRREMYRRILMKESEDLPLLPIGFIPRFFFARDYVKGFSTDGEGVYRWWGGGVDRAWVDKGGAK
jgi:peptide/nickel transport system substrate-binding protein